MAAGAVGGWLKGKGLGFLNKPGKNTTEGGEPGESGEPAGEPALQADGVPTVPGESPPPDLAAPPTSTAGTLENDAEAVIDDAGAVAGEVGG